MFAFVGALCVLCVRTRECVHVRQIKEKGEIAANNKTTSQYVCAMFVVGYVDQQ